MLVQVSELAGLRPGSVFSGYSTLDLVESCIALDLRLPIGGVQSVTAWHCLSLLIRVMATNGHGLTLPT
jgi:hypothetical protein